MNKAVTELFTVNTEQTYNVNWGEVVTKQQCTYLERKCLKIRKSQPEVSIGSCSVSYGKDNSPIIICPHRLLERNKIFTDCLHLLTLHEPGNDFHVVSELTIPGGNVDYVLISARKNRVMDFVGIELQTMDTTGTVWPDRQRFLQSVRVDAPLEEQLEKKSYGMNWKMTAKTTLVQMHHKIETFEILNKHLVLVLQDQLLEYMQRMFSFGHIKGVRTGDPMHFHSYNVKQIDRFLQLELTQRLSTDSAGVATCLGLQAESSVELQDIITQLEEKMTETTLLSVFPLNTEQIAPTEEI